MTTTAPVRHYCTLFDRTYLIKGLAMYQSLEQHAGDFRLFILCMDDLAYDVLDQLKLRHAELIRLSAFENADLLAVKADRSVAEYCWTCAPCLPAYLLERHPGIDFITYLDADLLFFSSPEPVYSEIGCASSVIVEHRFAPLFQPSIVNGKYNVQWVSFRRDVHGLETLHWWRDKCIEWCYYRLEDDRMGDQKYLDCWTERFQGVHELQHVGAGTGPWNFSNYRIQDRDQQVWVDDVPLVFYHFHGYRMLENGRSVAMPSVYTDDTPVPRMIYDRYDKALLQSLATIRQVDPDFSYGIETSAREGFGALPSARAAGESLPAPFKKLLRKITPRFIRNRPPRI